MSILSAALRGLLDTNAMRRNEQPLYVDAATRTQWPESYKRDRNFDNGPDDTWADRISFRPKDADGMYVMYSKEMSIDREEFGNRGEGERNIGDYQVFGYYPTVDDYTNSRYDNFEHIARSRGGFGWDFQKAYLAETAGSLTNNMWKILKDWTASQGHTVDPHTVTDWSDPPAKRKGGADGSALRAMVADMYHDADTWDDGSFGEMCVDLGILNEKKASNRGKALKALKGILDDPDFDWLAAQDKALSADWDVFGWNVDDDDEEDGDDDAIPDSSPANPASREDDERDSNEGLYDRAVDLYAELDGKEANDEIEWASEDDIEKAASNGDAPLLREIIQGLEEAIRYFSKQTPVEHTDDDVVVLPPGTVQEGGEAAGHEDTEARVPVDDTDHPRPTTESPALNDAEDAEDDVDPVDGEQGRSAEDRLQDMCAKLKVKKKSMRATLPNEIEFKLKQAGETKGKPYYTVTCEAWLSEEDFEQFLDAAGIIPNKKRTKVKSGFGKKFLTFEQDSDGEWDVKATRNLTLEEAVDWIGHMARVRTDGETEEAAGEEPGDLDIGSLLDRMTFEDVKPDGAATGDEDEDDDDYGSAMLADEWHEMLTGEMGMSRTSQTRYKRDGKDGKDIVVKLVNHPDGMLSVRGFKEAVLLHGNKKILQYEDPDELYQGVRLLLPKKDSLPVERAGDQVETTSPEDDDTGFTVFDDIFVVEWANVDYLALDAEEDHSSFLAANGFVWHPPIYVFPFRSKAKGLKTLDKLKAAGIEIINEDEIVTAVNGRRVKPTPFDRLMREQAKESRRKAKDMGFSVHLTQNDEGQKVLMVTSRRNNRKAEVAFKRNRWKVESAGYWLPVADKKAAKKALKSLHKAGVRLGDTEDFVERWESIWGGKPPVDFSVTKVTKEPKQKKAPAAKKDDAERGVPKHIKRMDESTKKAAMRFYEALGYWPDEGMGEEDIEDLLDDAEMDD